MAAMIPMLILVAGCPRLGLCVRVTDTSASSFIIDLGEGKTCEGAPEVTRVTIRRLDDEQVLWHITSAEGTPLSELIYGELPDGFSQGLEATQLTPGERIDIAVDGRDALSGGVAVTVTE
jgi:hypothetical protein